ncbi:hypothetical protein Hsar01_00691 [Haloferula sargassicola]|uniref:HTH araC/xylS-type domain-containing protein n=2 Tax=Haloferula sargassicola TaxID=490096 RepID=A0ABP9UJC0_9BACT
MLVIPGPAEPYLAWRRGSVLALAGAMIRWTAIDGDPAAEEQPWPRPVKVVWKLLTQHSSRSLDLGSLGGHLGVRPARLGDEFTRATGMPFRQWLGSERCATGSRLLVEEPARTIGEIAARCSPQSISQFNRNFLAFAGQSPRDFREAFAPTDG